MRSSIVITLIALLGLAACKKDSVSPTSSAIKALSGSWSTSGGYVKVGGVDISSDYANFKITFSASNSGDYIYLVENGSHAFEGIQGDTWSFDGSSFTAIKRGSDGIVMTYAIKDKVMTLTFTTPNPIPADGRINGLYGDFEMKLTKK